jgi:sulfate adenylyltransferase
MPGLVVPHGGGGLRPLLLPENDRADAIERAKDLLSLPMSSREVSDLLMLGMGAYTPLDGFMGAESWRSVCTEMKLPGGALWPIPITLSCNKEWAGALTEGQEVALVDAEGGAAMGILTLTEVYTPDKALECESVFGTADPSHPGVAKVMAQGEVNLGGSIAAFSEGVYPGLYPALYRRPEQTRARFESLGWSKIAAFQTRNPMHRSHEYIAKVAIEMFDGVFIHQVLGALKGGDIPAEVRTQAIDALVRNYFAPGTCIQSGYPIEMRYAGPREAVLHAVLRQNFGCSHLIVGRDHAGVGSFYGPFDAHRIFDTLPPGSLEIEAMKFDATFFCYGCQGIASARTCPHGEDRRLVISGTRLREMFVNREPIPPEYSRPEVLAVLQEYYDGQT